jgi:hypothetical protein
MGLPLFLGIFAPGSPQFAPQKIIKMIGVIKGRVKLEDEPRHIAQAQIMGKLAAEIGRRPAQRSDQCLRPAAAKPGNKGRGVVQIGAEANLCHGYESVPQVGIMHVATLEDIGKGVADFLSHAKLA